MQEAGLDIVAYVNKKKDESGRKRFRINNEDFVR